MAGRPTAPPLAGLSRGAVKQSGTANSEICWKMDIDSHVNKVQKFVRAGNYHAAINIALSGLNECRRNDDQAGVDTFLGIIEGIAKTLAHEFGSREYQGGRTEGKRYTV